MSRMENCILTNMCMICDGNKVLVQDRKNPNWPGITFPGGHVKPEESFVESVIREVKEETNLDIAQVKLCGVKQWTSKSEGYRYLVFFFRTDTFSGTLKSSNEGEVFWIEKEHLHNYQLADGFAGMYEVFEQEELSENYYWLENNQWKTKNL